MRLALLVLLVGLLLAAAAWNTLLPSTDAKAITPTITACADQGESCSQATLDGPSISTLEHTVYAGGCSQTDLHVVRYVPADSPDGRPVVATWCA